MYSRDYDGRRAPPNRIDTEELKKTHFDLGHEEADWNKKTYATSERKPTKEFIDLQQSNAVFQGDGMRRHNTSYTETVGIHDHSVDGRGIPNSDARADHMNLGTDQAPYVTTYNSANALAGKGRPAEQSTDLHLMRGGNFARGGIWDPYVVEDQVSLKPYRPVEQLPLADTRFQVATHFDLEATAKRKSRFKTEYFEKICRPTIMC
jgi:hypothetical protein